MMRLLVTGSRDWSDYSKVLGELKYFHNAFGVELVVHGDCRGADRLAGRAARELGLDVWAFPADWKRHGKAAGPIRNEEMLIFTKPQYVLAFHDAIDKSKGTKDMVKRSRKAGLPVLLVKHQGPAELLQDV